MQQIQFYLYCRRLQFSSFQQDNKLRRKSVSLFYKNLQIFNTLYVYMAFSSCERFYALVFGDAKNRTSGVKREVT